MQEQILSATKEFERKKIKRNRRGFIRGTVRGVRYGCELRVSMSGGQRVKGKKPVTSAFPLSKSGELSSFEM